MRPRKGEVVVDQNILFFRVADSYNAIYEFKTLSGMKVSSASGALSALDDRVLTPSAHGMRKGHHQAPLARDMHHHPTWTAAVPPARLDNVPQLQTHQIPQI